MPKGVRLAVLAAVAGLAVVSAHGSATDEAALPPLSVVPAGEFVMGAEDGDDDARPAHRVSLDGFAIGTREVTVEEYARFVRETGHRAPAVRELPEIVRASGREALFRESAKPYEWRDGSPPADRLQHPVVLVTRDDAEAYCAWLGQKTGKPFRLPSEAEWERAARGGLVGKRYPWGDELTPSHANWLDDASLRPKRGTKPVGSYASNGLGLLDVAGNAWEWVADWYARYDPGTAANPHGPTTGTQRIVRGGAWLDSDPLLLAVSHRHEVPPDTYSYSIGFRVAHSVPAAPPARPPEGAVQRATRVGAAECLECHARVHKRWSAGRHSRMVQPATAESVKGDFSARSVTLRGKRYGLRAEGGAFFVTESYLQEQERERRVELTLGNRRVQHYLARLDDGRIVVLPPSWDVERKQWFHNMEIVDPEESTGTALQVWSTACFGCHVSGQVKVKDPASHAVTSRWTEFGTSCERCHGPGAEHLALYRGDASVEVDGPGIVRPSRLPPAAGSMVCAQCHSLRDVTAGGFDPGADYHDHFLPVLEYAQEQSADLAYWADGRPRRFSNDAIGLWQSACFLRGRATCTSCHEDPHLPDVDRNPQLEKAGLCLRCHEGVGRDLAAHTRHDPAGPGSACVECHMPKTVVGVKGRMRDHAIGVPVPENTVRFGIPNACTECHPDRIAQWAASVLASWHPASPRRARLLRRAETFTAARARDQAAVSRLAALADDADEAPVTRANALGYLRLFTDDPRAGAALARGLAADHPLPRAVAALGFVDVAPDDAAKAALIAALGDARRVVRVGAALALASHGVARLPGRDGERLASAQTEYAARAELNPEDAGTLLEVGKFHLAVERWEPAQRTLQEAFAVDPDRPTLRYYLGLALLRRLRVDDGRRMLGKVPPHDPHHATARQLLARLEKLR